DTGAAPHGKSDHQERAGVGAPPAQGPRGHSPAQPQSRGHRVSRGAGSVGAGGHRCASRGHSTDPTYAGAYAPHGSSPPRPQEIRTSVIVSDKNLLVYLYIRGQRTAQAEAVLVRDPAWTAPLLWRSEFRNALAGLVRTREIDLDDAVRISHDAERRMRGGEF